MTVKTSYGIILCCKDENKYKILMIRRRHTYSYAEFVIYLSHIRKSTEKINCQSIRDKFNKMTIYEHQLLSTLDDKIINNSIFPNNTNTFELQVNLKIHGQTILHLLEISNSTHSCLWEFPKGRQCDNELPLHCALREFSEETNMVASNIIPGIRLRATTKSGKKIYDLNYYISIIPKLSYNFQKYSKMKMSEISEIKWMTLEEISFNEKHIYNLAKSAIKIAKKYTAGTFISKYKNELV